MELDRDLDLRDRTSSSTGTVHASDSRDSNLPVDALHRSRHIKFSMAGFYPDLFHLRTTKKRMKVKLANMICRMLRTATSVVTVGCM